MTTPDVPHRMELSVELPGTPAQVWDAIATGTASAWFMPTDLEERVGGGRIAHMGEDSVRPAGHGWEPPHHLAYEEPGWASLAGHEGADVTPLVTEFLIEASFGGTCMLRVVTALRHRRRVGAGVLRRHGQALGAVLRQPPPLPHALPRPAGDADGRRRGGSGTSGPRCGPRLRASLGGQEVGAAVDARGVSAQVERVSGDRKVACCCA